MLPNLYARLNKQKLKKKKKKCKFQKYFVKKFQNFDLARFKCMSRKMFHDDIYRNTSRMSL